MFRIACLVLTLAAAKDVVGSCGGEKPSPVEDCQNVDYGSCGNACCKMDFSVEGTSTSVMTQLNASLSNGGVDGNYELKMTAEGTLGFGDLIQFGSPFGFDYIGQVHHTTSGPAHYVDTVNFNIKTGKSGHSTLRAFSTSQIAGALGDNGQNYKNIVTAIKAAFGADVTGAFVDGSCGSSTMKV